MKFENVHNYYRLFSYMSSKMKSDLVDTMIGGISHFIHISHNDLDGYGCNVVKNLACLDLGTYSPLNDHVSDPVYNTSKLNDAFYDVLHEYLRIELNSNEFSKDCNRVGILITDIGGLKFDKIQQVLQDVLIREQFVSKLEHCEEINVYIVDHHRSEYMNSDQITDFDNLDQFNGIKYVYFSDKDTRSMCYGCIAGSSVVNLIKINYFYVFDTAECATSLLKETLNLTNYPTLDQYVENVRAYDTGKCDQWELSDTDDLLYMVTKVDPGIILNTEIQMANKNKIDMTRLTQAIAARIMSGSLYPTDIDCITMHHIHDEILKMNKDYATFVGMVKLMEIRDLPEYMRDYKISVVVPEHMDDHLVVGVIMDTEKYNNYNFTSYSKRFFKEYSCCNGLIRGDLYDDFPSISTRSPDGKCVTLNCYEFCKANGGGGHIHAAGFPIHMEK